MKENFKIKKQACNELWGASVLAVIVATSCAQALIAMPAIAQETTPLSPVTVNPNQSKPASKLNQTTRKVTAARTRTTRNRNVNAQPKPVPVVAAPPPVIPPPVFTGLQSEGLAAQGYKSSTASYVGPLGQMPLQDTPYSVYVTPHELIDNTIATTTDDVFRVNPFTQETTSTGRNGREYVNIRGFSVLNNNIDGLKINQEEVVPLEDKERIEVFTGLTGFLFGQSDPGGTINYVLKRPTAKPFEQITIADIGGQSPYGHLDIGGPIDPEGRFGYRINIAGKDGYTNIYTQKEIRELYSGAFDWHITDHALLQFDIAHSYDKLWSPPAGFGSATNSFFNYLPVPRADLSWSEPWLSTRDNTDRGGMRFTWDINSMFTFRSAFNISDQGNRFLTYNNNNFTMADQSNPFSVAYFPVSTLTKSEYAFVDAKFNTGPIEHKLTAGFNGSYFDAYQGTLDAQVCIPTGSIGFASCQLQTGTNLVPIYSQQPYNYYYYSGGQNYESSKGDNNNAMIGDVITLNPKMQVLVGLTRSEIGAVNYNTNGTQSSATDKVAYTPSASLVFKPLPWITTYATYIQGLEQGVIVPSGYTNSGSALAPAIDEQDEVGVKVTTGGVLWTAALFKINKINQFSNGATPTPTYVQDGREIHKGGEISATGKLTDDLTIVSGFTAFDARVTQANTASLNGTRPPNVSNILAKTYFEYRLPFFHQIFLNGAVNFASSYSGNAANTIALPSAATYDLGARYETTVDNHPVIFRVYATNILNHSYWESAGSLGDARKVSFSGTVRF